MVKYLLAGIIIAAVLIGGFVLTRALNVPYETADGTGSGGIVPSTGCSGSGDKCSRGYTCIEECGPPVVSDQDSPPGWYCAPDSVAKEPRNCPICLDANTMIATPQGAVPVTDVKAGMLVWTQDAKGNRVAAPVIKIGRTRAPSDHHMIDLGLSDGREVSISPNHPLVDGRAASEAQIGEIYDSSDITTIKISSYQKPFTYDILPAGETGMYWGNGIPLKSTLD